MDLAVSQKRWATFFLGVASSMIAPSPSTCGGGAGGGLSFDVLSATLLAVVFEVLEDWRGVPLRSVEGKGGIVLESWRVRLFICWLSVFGGLVKGRVGARLVSLESGEGPCALVLAQERMRSVTDGESGEVFFIDMESGTQRDGPEGGCRGDVGRWRAWDVEIVVGGQMGGGTELEGEAQGGGASFKGP
jgi:hypothetical protein